MPILVSLETSDDELVALRALELHQHLHTKHPTLVNVRFIECARASYDYQRSLTAEVSGECRRASLALLADAVFRASEWRCTAFVLVQPLGGETSLED